MDTSRFLHVLGSPYGKKGKQVIGIRRHPANNNLFISCEGYYNFDKSCIICNHRGHGKSIDEAVANVIYVAGKYYSGEWEGSLDMDEDFPMLVGA